VFIYSIIIHPQTQTYLSKLQYIAEIVTFKKWMIKTNIFKTLLNPFQHHCPIFVNHQPELRHGATTVKRNSNFQLK